LTKTNGRFLWASTVPDVIPKALNHPSRNSTEDAIKRARRMKAEKPYRRTRAQIAAAKRVTDRILGERD